MDNLFLTALRAFYLILPILAAFFSAKIFRKNFRSLNSDVNKKIFGNYTYKQIVAAILASIIAAYIQFILYDFAIFREISLYNYSSMPILYGFLLGAGFVIGTLLNLFLKQRKFGKEMLLKETTFFKISIFFWAILFAVPLYLPTLDVILIIVLFVLILNFFHGK